MSKGALCLYKKFNEMGNQFYNAYITYMKITRGPIFVGNPDCVKGVINNLYWAATEMVKGKSDEEGGMETRYIILAVAIAVVFVTALTLFIIYYRRRSAASEDATTGDPAVSKLISP